MGLFPRVLGKGRVGAKPGVSGSLCGPPHFEGVLGQGYATRPRPDHLPLVRPLLASADLEGYS